MKIQSFGNTQGESHDLDPKLNVFYGPNEAGKSTLRSFITTTLFPKSGLKYPSQKKSDSGSVDVELSNGSLKTYSKDGKNTKSDAPDICGIDDKEYISIYSMSPADLRDMKSIEKGGIRNRFLTIPGGADLPNAYDTLDKERHELLPEMKRSPSCKTALLIQAENSAKQHAEQLKNRESGDAHYAELVSKRTELKESIEKLEHEVRKKDEIRADSLKADAFADNIKKIEKLEKREKELTYSEGIDEQKLKDLESEVNSCNKIAKSAHEKADNIAKELGRYDYKAILNRKKEIAYIDKNSLVYEQQKRSAGTPSQTQQQQPPTEPKSIAYQKRGIPSIIAIGAIVTIMSIAVMAMVNVFAGLAATIIGLIITVLGFTKTRTVVVSSASKHASTPAPAQPVVETKSELVEYVDTTLNIILSEIGMKSNGFHNDLQKLTDLVNSAEKYQDALKETETTDKDLRTAKEKVDAFLDGFGGREKYDQAIKDKQELNDIRVSLETLREGTKNAPISEIDSETARSEYESAVSDLRKLEKDLGTINQAITGIMEDTEVERAITAWNDAESAAYLGALRWASLTLERILLDTASSEAYENHRPDVLSKADKFLELMTCGRYRMNTDPRITDIAVIDTETGDTKSGNEWSTGLEDQVKLALKLAVSLSLSKEKPPVILDDILLTSDSERKKGACEAISLLSEDIQVLYFTCDKETRNYMEQTGASIVDM